MWDEIIKNRGQGTEPVLVSENLPRDERINEPPIELNISKLNIQPESSNN